MSNILSASSAPIALSDGQNNCSLAIFRKKALSIDIFSVCTIAAIAGDFTLLGSVDVCDDLVIIWVLLIGPKLPVFVSVDILQAEINTLLPAAAAAEGSLPGGVLPMDCIEPADL